MNPKLESRVSSLEKQLRRQQVMGAIAALCLVAVFTLGADEKGNELRDVVKAKNIVIADGEGKDSALLSKSGIVFFNGQGTPMALYSNLGITLYGRDGGVVVTISESEEGSGSITLRNKAGEMIGTGGAE